MKTIEIGDEFEHQEHGAVVVKDIQESLNEAYITVKDTGLVLDGASVDKTSVRFLSKTVGLTGSEPLLEFCENVGFGESNKD